MIKVGNAFSSYSWNYRGSFSWNIHLNVLYQPIKTWKLHNTALEVGLLILLYKSKSISQKQRPLEACFCLRHVMWWWYMMWWWNQFTVCVHIEYYKDASVTGGVWERKWYKTPVWEQTRSIVMDHNQCCRCQHSKMLRRQNRWHEDESAIVFRPALRYCHWFFSLSVLSRRSR